MVLLSNLNNDQIKQLAHLHHRAMHSLLTDLGLPFIERYYQIACKDSSVIGIYALGADANPLGWAVGSPRPDQVNHRMSEARGWFLVQMMRVLITNPKSIWQVILSWRSTSVTMKEGAIELTYLGVDASARKQGLGGKLLIAFIEAAQERGYTSIELSVEADNTAAIALYTRVGFQIIASFKEGAFNRHRMELTLQ